MSEQEVSIWVLIGTQYRNQNMLGTIEKQFVKVFMVLNQSEGFISETDDSKKNHKDS
jgi:hypothetical protein